MDDLKAERRDRKREARRAKGRKHNVRRWQQMYEALRKRIQASTNGAED